MKISKIILKWLLFITGLLIMSFGVAFSVKANLGISPISCIPYIFSLEYSLTLGQITIVFNIILILLQILVLRKKYKLLQLIQLPVVFVFGSFIDFAMYLFSGLTITGYFSQLLFCLLSCIILGIGVFIEVRAKTSYLPGEGLALAISKTFNIEFGKAKVGTDVGMVLTGLISSMILFQDIQGIREGTILAALLVGSIVKYLNKKIVFCVSALA